jgi:hypothetical protein
MRLRRPASELRIAIDCMPLRSRKAMLGGIEANNIIVGAYTDRHGGVCPMLAAHRNGGRTDLASIALDELPDLPRRDELPRARPADTGERHRARELRDRPGWAWMRPFRRLDEYERALAEIEGAERDRRVEELV